MFKLTQALQSRTFWTIVVLVSLNTIPQLRGMVSTSVLDMLNVILGAVATAFHINPSQNY